MNELLWEHQLVWEQDEHKLLNNIGGLERKYDFVERKRKEGKEEEPLHQEVCKKIIVDIYVKVEE